MAEAKKNPECERSKEQRSPARIVSGAGSLKRPNILKSGIGEVWSMFFAKTVSKGLPRPFNAAGWRCSKVNVSSLAIINYNTIGHPYLPILEARQSVIGEIFGHNWLTS